MRDKTKNANKTTMAYGGDQVSLLAEKLETVSTSESELYKEAKVSGKGVGCIATKVIKKGGLVLREAPQLFHPDVGFCYYNCPSLDAIREKMLEKHVPTGQRYQDLQ